MENMKRMMREVQNKGYDGASTKDTTRTSTSTSTSTSTVPYTVKENKRDTFQSILKLFQNAPPDTSLEHLVTQHYELCDYSFMESLQNEITDCITQNATVEVVFYQDLLAAINRVMVTKLTTAENKLKQILSKKELYAMESEIVAMARRSEIDESVLLLLEGNIQQAVQAHATGAVEMLTKLKNRMIAENNKKLPVDQQLLRELLACNVSAQRKELLYNYMKPSKSLTKEGM